LNVSIPLGGRLPPPPSYSSPYRVSYGSLNTVGRAGGEAGLEPLARLNDQALGVDEPAAPAEGRGVSD